VIVSSIHHAPPIRARSFVGERGRGERQCREQSIVRIGFIEFSFRSECVYRLTWPR
jgi:hypothetical protein